MEKTHYFSQRVKEGEREERDKGWTFLKMKQISFTLNSDYSEVINPLTTGLHLITTLVAENIRTNATSNNSGHAQHASPAVCIWHMLPAEEPQRNANESQRKEGEKQDVCIEQSLVN